MDPTVVQPPKLSVLSPIRKENEGATGNDRHWTIRGLSSAYYAVAGFPNAAATKTAALAVDPTVNAVLNRVPDMVESLAENLGHTISREVTPASSQLCDFTSLLQNLYEQLQSKNSIPNTLWIIKEVMGSIDSLLAGCTEAPLPEDHIVDSKDTYRAANQGALERLEIMFQVPLDLRASKTGKPTVSITDKTTFGIIEQLRAFRYYLQEYKTILDGKQFSSKEYLTDLRHGLMKLLIKEEEGSTRTAPAHAALKVELTAANPKCPSTALQDEIEKKLRADKDDIQPTPNNPLAGLIGEGLLDVFLEIKNLRQGKMAHGIEKLCGTAVEATARKAVEFFGKFTGYESKGCFQTDDLDLPPLELVDMEITDNRDPNARKVVNATVQRVNVLHRQVSIARVVEIFNEYVIHGENQGMYEVWGKSLQIFFGHLLKDLEENKKKNNNADQGPLAIQQYNEIHSALQKSIELLEETFTINKPSKERIQQTFASIGELMTNHPLLVLQGLGELDIGNMLGGADVKGATLAPDAIVDGVAGGDEAAGGDGAVATVDGADKKTITATIREGVQKSQRKQQSSIKTPEEEQAIFNNRLTEAGVLGHLFSVYSAVMTLLRGDQTERKQFNEIYNAIPKSTKDGRPLSDKKIRELFEQKLQTDLIDTAGDVWIFVRWLIKLLLPVLSWAIRSGMDRFVNEAKKSISSFVEEAKPSTGDGELPLKTLDRIEAAAGTISAVTQDQDLRLKGDGKGDIFKRGLLQGPNLDTRSKDSSPSDIYATFTRKMIDDFFPKTFTWAESLDNVSRKITEGVSTSRFAIIRTVLSVASLAVRIPLYGLNFLIVRPLQGSLNWVIKTGMKKFLVYIGVVEKAMGSTISSLEKDPTKRTVITPIIDKSVLEMLETLWQSLHTSESGEIIDTSQIKFPEASPKRKEKQKAAFSAIFEAVQKIQEMNKGTDKDAPIPVVGGFTACLKDKAKHIGLDASSDISIAAINTLTQPKMLYHMMGTALDAMNSSMKSDGNLDLEDDEDLRGQIQGKVKQLVALSIQRAGDVLQEKDGDCNKHIMIHAAKVRNTFISTSPTATPPLDEAAAVVAGGDDVTTSGVPSEDEKQKHTNMIKKWETALNAYSEDPISDDNFKNLLSIRYQLFSIWKNLQGEIIILEQDKSTHTTSLNIHKRHLDRIVKALLTFQDEYLSIFDSTVRNKFSEKHPEVVTQLVDSSHRCEQISRLLDTCTTEIQTSDKEQKIGEVKEEYLEQINTHIEEIKKTFIAIEQQIKDDDEVDITDDMQALIFSAKDQVYFLTELYTQMKSQAKMSTFTKKLLGEKISEVRAAQELSFSESLKGKYKGEIDKYYRQNIQPELREVFPNYNDPKSSDHITVGKIYTRIQTLSGLAEELEVPRESHISAIKELVKRATKTRQRQTLDHMALGIKVLRGRQITTDLEKDKLTALTNATEEVLGAEHVKYNQKKDTAISHLKALEKATHELKNVTPMQYSPLPELTTVPLLRSLLQHANLELENRVISVYEELASQKDIASFLALRLIFIPSNRSNNKG